MIKFIPENLPPLKLLSKLSKVSSQIKSVEKAGKNEKQHYAFYSEAQIKSVVKPLLDAEKILIFFSAEEKEFMEIGKTSNGQPMWITKVRTHYTLIDSDTGEGLQGYYDSNGSDTGDKGGFKAITGAVKNILMQNFLIASGDDQEAETETKGAKPKVQAVKKTDFPVHKAVITMPNELCKFNTGPMKWSGPEQKELIKSGKFAIETGKRSDGKGNYYKLGNEAGQWGYLKDQFVDFMANEAAKKNSQLETAKQVFQPNN